MVRQFLLLIACAFCLSLIRAEVLADEPDTYQKELERLAEFSPISTSIGVTRKGVAIPAFLTNGMLDLASEQTRILMVSNLKPGAKVSRQLVSEWNEFCSRRPASTGNRKVALGIVPFANPDSFEEATARSGNGGWSSGFPPAGSAYNDEDQSERHYLWRWIGMLAPDIVIVVRANDVDTLVIPESLKMNQIGVNARLSLRKAKPESLVAALSTGKPADVASVPAVEFLTNGHLPLLPEFIQLAGTVRSSARKELLDRKQRTPIEVAEELAESYGHNLNSVAYIPALALVGRVRLSELTENESHLKDVLKIVETYASEAKSALGKRASGSTLSGHLIFGELAKKTDDRRFTKLVQAAADLGFDDAGKPRQAMPYHNEMSDAVFMGTPILVQAGRLTGESKYFDMADRHSKFMLKLNLRQDGLHQHSPLDPEHTAWGRGNGFPALGLALSISDMPADSKHLPSMMAAYREHLLAMIDHQDEMGMWHQIVDRPESYREFTVTCMTTFAIVRGLRNGWLDRSTFEPFVQRAWESIKCRIGPDGRLVDVCTGTGKQKSRQAYYDRTAILGRDDRGGAMALMVSTELAFAKREGVVQLLDAGSGSR